MFGEPFPRRPERPQSEDEIMSAFAETGDPKTPGLTIELARKMQLGPDMLREIDGATEEDIILAEERDREFGEQFSETFLKPYGLDDQTLLEIFAESEESYVRHLIDVTQIPPDRINPDKQESDRNAILRARALLIIYVQENEQAVLRLCNAVRLDSADGVRDVQILKYIHNYFYDRFFVISNKYDDEQTADDIIFAERAVVVLNQFAEFSKEVLHTQWNPETNYLAAAYMHDLAIELNSSEPTTLDNDELFLIDELVGLERVADFNPDTLFPFEISKGKLAMFGSDMNTIYVLDEHDSANKKPIFEALKSQVHYTVAGQFFARRVIADVPVELSFETEVFYDVGNQLGRDDEYLFRDDIHMRDYLYLLHQSMRDTVEREFGFSLAELEINEQIYFLDYLQHTTFEKVMIIKSFLQTYGVTGMRTFLALEHGGKDLGDKIISFGQYPELAKKVFDHFTELLDTAQNAEELVRLRLGEQVDIETLTQTIDAVRTDILATAQRDLERAVKAGNPGEVSQKIESYSADARVYVTLLKEVARTPLESVSAMSLDDNFKMAARRLSEQNYANETPEFQAIIQKSLDDAFLRKNTRFYTEVDVDGRVIFFDRFDDMLNTNGTRIKYFGSVNSDPAYAGIGKMRIGETLDKEIEDCDVMYAHCDPRNPISQYYIEHGFIATQTVAPAGKFSFEIWRSKESSEQLQTKKMSPEALVAIAGNSMDAGNDYFVREVRPNDPFHELDDGLGYLMTRYFTHHGKVYAAFEINTDLSKQFVIPQPKE